MSFHKETEDALETAFGYVKESMEEIRESTAIRSERGATSSDTAEAARKLISKGASDTDRGNENDPPRISEETLREAMSLNDQGRTKEAWNLLAREGDEYADNARDYLDFAENSGRPFGTPKDSQKHFDTYARTTLAQDGRLPSVSQIRQSYRELTESTPIPEIFPFVFNIIGLHPSRIDESHPPVPFIDDAYPSTFNAFPQNPPSNPPGTTTFLGENGGYYGGDGGGDGGGTRSWPFRWRRRWRRGRRLWWRQLWRG